MIELPLTAGADEDYDFTVTDLDGEPVADSVPVALRVEGMADFACEVADSDANRTLHLEAAQTEAFHDGVHRAQLLAFEDDDPRLVEHALVYVTTLIPTEA